MRFFNVQNDKMQMTFIFYEILKSMDKNVKLKNHIVQ